MDPIFELRDVTVLLRAAFRFGHLIARTCQPCFFGQRELEASLILGGSSWYVPVSYSLVAKAPAGGAGGLATQGLVILLELLLLIAVKKIKRQGNFGLNYDAVRRE